MDGADEEGHWRHGREDGRAIAKNAPNSTGTHTGHDHAKNRGIQWNLSRVQEQRRLENLLLISVTYGRSAGLETRPYKANVIASSPVPPTDIIEKIGDEHVGSMGLTTY